MKIPSKVEGLRITVMRITRQQDYAVILMAHLAKDYGVRMVPLSEVAKIYRLSPLFLRQIASVLKKHGLLISREGVKGGYKLIRDPADISVADVIEAFEGSTALTICGAHGAGLVCDKEAFCHPQITWAKINQEIRQVLHKKTLAQFL
ncbi:Rrf2 family transcriptional regulator [Candidatus Daviesbacteria bacterium]|nr:Rrf2 family transcriptional regulator [Candidatus Daviesbacteria bacterium]